MLVRRTWELKTILFLFLFTNYYAFGTAVIRSDKILPRLDPLSGPSERGREEQSEELIFAALVIKPRGFIAAHIIIGQSLKFLEVRWRGYMSSHIRVHRFKCLRYMLVVAYDRPFEIRKILSSWVSASRAYVQHEPVF
ncbi:hypothetical protein AOQ84DRAFT_356704 [Glonium stellatum]|uniref:Uncharacterized protein n=1 Tax=Glonium stellatum TaxID=574774 RepID=A0A8E2JNL7_9PEZI|nr:hypothetical protein AOQ84DRAFT_356704 [Glonium stellatum]